MIRTGSLVLVILAWFVLPMLCGCSGDNSAPPFPFQLSINWSARARQMTAPSSALSCQISLYTNAQMTGKPVYQWKINRQDGPAAYLQQWTAPVQLASPQWYVDIKFFALADGAGDLVAEGNQFVMLDLTGKGAESITLNQSVASVEVPAGQTVPLGGSQDLVFTARDATGAAIAVTPGSVTWSVVDTSTNVVFNNGSAQGFAAGVAQVSATVDGVASPAVTVTVVSN